METRIQREQFLRALETVKVGLAQREIIEQSTCFVFEGGRVITYNDEASCSGPSGLPAEFKGAVQAQPVLEVLRRWSRDEITATDEGGQLVMRCGRASSGNNMEAEIRLPYGGVDDPGEWTPLPEDFGEAVAMVQAAAAREESRVILTRVNIARKWIEACDDFQACRWYTKTGVKQPTQIKRTGIEAVTSLGATEFSETENWIHFRNPKGFVLSCRRYLDDFPTARMTEMFQTECKPVSLPKALAEAAEIANIHSQHSADDNLLEVTLKPDRIVLVGRGATGWYREAVEGRWDGDPLSFMLSPSMLTELVNKFNDVQVSDTVIKVDGGSYVYMSMTTPPDDEEDKPAPKKKKKKEAEGDE